MKKQREGKKCRSVCSDPQIFHSATWLFFFKEWMGRGLIIGQSRSEYTNVPRKTRIKTWPQ